MYEVTYCRRPSDTTVLLGIREDGGEVCRLTLGLRCYVEVGSPVRGTVLDEQTVILLRGEDECRRAVERAMRLLAYADNSERMLWRKLRAKGFSEAAASYAATYAVREGLLDERRQLRTQILSLANQRLYGPLRIPRHLASKGYALREVRDVQQELIDAGEIDVADNFRRLLDKQGDRTDMTVRKLRFTYGYGGADCDEDEFAPTGV